MKIKFLLITALFCAVLSIKAQITISKCATSNTVASEANCPVSLPDFTNEIVAEDPISIDPIMIVQEPVPGTIVGFGETIVTFRATNPFGSDTCQSTFTVINTPGVCFTNVPDDNLEQALIDLGYDSGALDDYVPTTNIKNVVSLDISNENIASLTGIEAFEDLQVLNIANNTNVTEIDITENVKLTSLNISNTGIISIDISKNIVLEDFSANVSGLTFLDFDFNPELQTVSINGSTALTTLDFELNRKLNSVSLNMGTIHYIKANNGRNSDISFFDIRNQSNLLCVQVDSGRPVGGYSGWTEDLGTNYSIDCGGTYVPDDNFEQALIDIGIDTSGLDNFVNTRDINLAALTVLNLERKNIEDLTGIEAFKTVRELLLKFNKLTTLDISTLTELRILSVTDLNQLTYLDLTRNTQLQELTIKGNKLTTLHLENNSQLQRLSASNNELTSLNISNNTKLQTIDLFGNKLTSFDSSNNMVLSSLVLANNKLASLNVANGNNSILQLNANNNLNLFCIQADEVGANYQSSWTIGDSIIDNDCDLSKTTTIPDDNFEQVLIDLGYDSVLDNTVYTTIVGNITTLNLANKGITNMTGIEDFVSLKSLSINDNAIKEIDVSNLTELTFFRATRCQLETLDLSNQSKLISLIVDSNDIVDLSLSSNVLTYLQITGNEIQELDLAQFPLLEQLYAGNNDIITIDFNSNSELYRVELGGNKISSIDISMLSKLRFLKLERNLLLYANIKNGNNVNLEELNVESNGSLSCITVDNAIDANGGTGNYANWKKTTNASYSDDCGTFVPDNAFEQWLIDNNYDTGIRDNYVPTVNIETITVLPGGSGGLQGKGITSLIGIEDFIALTQLSCDSNSLTSIDLSNNTALKTLSLNGNKLKTIDLSNNSQLTSVSIGDNQLEAIDLSNNTLLEHLNLYSNQLTSIDLNNNLTLRGLGLNGNQLTNLQTEFNVNLKRLSINNNKLTNLTLVANPNLTSIECNDNLLTSLNVSTNSLLESLYINGNQLINLDISTNSNLEELGCNSNNLTDLTLQSNTKLGYLYCNDNNITSINISILPLLEELEANNNELTYFNVKNGANVSTLSTLSINGNVNLTCIEVDDITAANAGTGNYGSWQKDVTALYSKACTNCSVAGTSIGSQAALDAFVTTLDSCNTIDGNLIIKRANDIVDLSGLSGVKIINGFLNIGDNDLLENLSGLENLCTVTEKISIFRNDKLIDITALSGITNPVKKLFIEDNQLLNDITTVLGFTITETLKVRDLTINHALAFPNIATLTGVNSPSDRPGSIILDGLTTSSVSFPNLTYVENIFTIQNMGVTAVSFPLLTKVGLNFSISNSNTPNLNFNVIKTVGGYTMDRTVLTDLSSFATLESIKGKVSISNNANLTSLTALNNVGTVTNVSVDVNSNNLLTNLDGLNFLSGTTELIVIENNSELISIDALQGITETGYFRVKNNAKLTNVNGLINLTETTDVRTGVFLQSTISGNDIKSINLTKLRTVSNQLNIDEKGVTDFCGLYSFVHEGNGQTKLNISGSNFTIADVLSCNRVVWSGISDTNWTDIGNWTGNTLPLINNDVVIPNATNKPVINSGVEVNINDLTVEASSSFNITENGAVIIDGNFTNNGAFNMTSDTSNSGVLIVKGTSNGEISYKRGGLLGNEWSMISAPVSGQSIKEFAENTTNNIRVNKTVIPNRYAIGYYDDSKAVGTKWTYYTTTDLTTNTLTFEKGRSYIISRETEGSVMFTGTIETTNVTKTVVASQWNAIGNPYTSFLPINKNGGTNLINDNIGNFAPMNVGVYIWDSGQNKYVGKSLISSESALAPGQGFFVKTRTGVSDVLFKEAQRKVQPVLGGIFSKGASLKKVPSIQLLATSKGVTVDTNIKYYPNASEGLDPGYDLGNYTSASFDVFTRLVDGSVAEDFTIQSLPNTNYETMIIPIGIKAKSGEEIRFSVKLLNLPRGIEVFIEDKELHTITKVGEGNKNSYDVKISKKVNGIGRFYVHTKLSEVPVETISIDEVKIYNLNNNELVIDGISRGDFELKLYSILGASITNRIMEGKGKNIISLPYLEAGVYIVKIDSEFGVKSQKIMIK